MLHINQMILQPKGLGNIEEGSIVFDGKDLIKEKELYLRDIRGRRISMIFQDPMTSLNPVITIGDQIAEILQLHNYGTKVKIQNRVEEILELVGIPPTRKNEYPHQFSGGMKQKDTQYTNLQKLALLIKND